MKIHQIISLSLKKGYEDTFTINFNAKKYRMLYFEHRIKCTDYCVTGIPILTSGGFGGGRGVGTDKTTVTAPAFLL